MRSKHSFREIVLTCASILLCLTLISTYLTAEMFARYVSADSASDSARVATFSVGETGMLAKSFSATFAPGVPSYKDINIENKSEVAISYTVTIRNESNNFDLAFRMGPSKDKLYDMTKTAEGYSYTTYFTEPTTQGYVLEILWKPSGDSKEDLMYMGAVDHITVTLVASQID